MIVGHIGGGAVGAGYQIEKSLRFRSTVAPSLSRTPSTPTDGKKWTMSMWFKKSRPNYNGGSGYDMLFGAGSTNSEAGKLIVGFNYTSVDTLIIGYGAANWRMSTQVFRDYTAWYHLVVVWDSANVDPNARLRVYLNGTEITSWGTNTAPTQNTLSAFNKSGVPQVIGAMGGPVYHWEGYLSEINFIDGQALTPNSFGEFNADGVWVPKKYTGTYGNNGFYLPFNDGTNLTELCRDRSGNGNHWTANNISLTAGATYDWMDDTPTNNFATLNPLDNANTLSNGNLTAGFVSANSTRSTFFINSGKWYVEAFCTGQTTDGGSIGHFGLVRRGQSLIGTMTSGMPNNFYGWATGTTNYPGAIQFGSGSSGPSNAYNVADNDILGILINFDANEIKYYKNNSLVYTSTAPSSDDWSISVGMYTGVVYNVNFGQRPFAYPPPAGFKALCTKNRPIGGSITTSGSFTGNANSDGPFVWLNGDPVSMTINGNAVTWGTHADKTAGGFKVRTNSASYNAAGTNNYVVTITGNLFGDEIYTPNTAKGNP